MAKLGRTQNISLERDGVDFPHEIIQNIKFKNLNCSTDLTTLTHETRHEYCPQTKYQ